MYHVLLLHPVEHVVMYTPVWANAVEWALQVLLEKISVDGWCFSFLGVVL